MPIAHNLCVAVIHTDVRREVRYYATSKWKRAARCLAGAAEHGSGCGNEPTRGGGSDGKDKGCDHRPKRDRRRRATDDAR